MTTEEKAKLYDDAIERASKLRVQNPFDTVSQMMEHVFPELKKSEDEIMRKAIIQFTKENGYKYTNYNGRKIAKEEMIDWLKSLKERMKKE